MSIRLRIALVFALALAIAFTLGSLILIRALSDQLVKSTDAALTIQLDHAAQYAPHNGAAVTFPARHATDVAEGEYVIQVIDPSGRVRGATPDSGSAPLISGAQFAAAQTGLIRVNASVDEDAFRLLAAPLAGRPGWVAVAGVPLASVNGAVNTATLGLLIGGAGFILIAGTGAYWLARAALNPVERLRREVAALSASDTSASVQVPGTKDEIAALAGTFNDLLDRLNAAMARQRAFVADASHELRTPLAVLGAELELASRPGRSRAELAEAVENATDELARLTRITNDLVVLARSDEDRLSLRLSEADVRALLERSAEASNSRARASDVECVVKCPPGLVAIVDPDRLRQAVDNLIDNALRFAPPGSQVAISGGSENGRLVIEIADSGPGFPADFLPKAFERFGRPDAGRARSDGGAGLGLAIVQAITAAHGGQVSARNQPTGGAVVRMELPTDLPAPD